MVNMRQSEISIENCCLKISSRCLSLSNNLLTLCLTMHNNINKAILSIVNKHINNSFANDKSQQTILATYQQHVNIISRVISLQTSHTILSSCKQSQQDSNKQFTNSKQTINRII